MLRPAALVVLANSFSKAMGPAGSDLLAFWGAGVVTAAGSPALAYDLAMQQHVQTGTGSAGWFAFVNPPPFLFLAAPLGLLPFPAAWIAWVALTFALWAMATVYACPRLWLLIPVFPGALLAAGHAQTGLLTGALLIAGVSLVERRPLLAGALLGALVVKPHLALLVPLWLAVGRRWGALFAAGTSAAGLLALSWAVLGNGTMIGYTTSWRASAALLHGAGPDLYLRMASLYAQLCLIVPPPAALAAHAVCAVLAAAAVVIGGRRFACDTLGSGALMLAASALASPYLFNYDLPFLILPLAWLVARGLEDGFRPYEKLALVGLYLAPFATRAASLPLGVNVMPLASLILLALVWTRLAAAYVPQSDGSRIPGEHKWNLGARPCIGSVETQK